MHFFDMHVSTTRAPTATGVNLAPSGSSADYEGTPHSDDIVHGGHSHIAAAVSPVHSHLLTFIQKISQVVLRSRVPLTPNAALLDVEALMDRTDFWRMRVPVNVDIFLAEGQCLLERWVVSFEPNKHPNPTAKTDTTDLILLVQSLYSYVRLMPLHSVLSDSILSKTHLNHCIATADGYSLSPSTPPSSPFMFDPSRDEEESGSSGFDVGSKLKVYKFRSASTSFGKLNLSVVYDSGVVGLRTGAAVSPVKSPSRVMSEDEDERKSRVVSRGRESHHKSGSPFPSPTMRKRVVSLANARAFGGAVDSIGTNPESARGMARPVDIPSSPLEKNLFTIDIKSPFDTPPSITITTSPRPPPPPPFELFGSLVGSYEESILTGRMSTLPSKPLPFLAEIGATGTGKCRPKCPVHAVGRFGAYFYELEEGGTPYVGCIEVGECWMNENVENADGGLGERCTNGYRIPAKGLLQIIIKNPSRTAIKVFLVPYDYTEMPANTQTFLRQKTYTSPLPTSTSTSNTKPNPNPSSPSRLASAVHLQFRMTKTNRLYLVRNVRVVFSSRGDDGGGKGRTVIDGPGEPKYVPYCGKGRGGRRGGRGGIGRGVMEMAGVSLEDYSVSPVKGGMWGRKPKSSWEKVGRDADGDGDVQGEHGWEWGSGVR